MQTGRFPIPDSLRDFVAKHLRDGQLAVLPIHMRHALRAGELPLYHHDPFDRMLAAQSLEEGLPLISRDALFTPYQIERVW